MKNNFLVILLFCLLQKADAQSHLGLEQYVYFGRTEDVSLVTVGYYQSRNNWYGEVRYNYEEKKTMSVYGGKTFYGDGKVSYAATPVLGLLLGQFNGGAIGGNFDASFKNFDISSQVQYVFSKDDHNRNFVLNWSELGYQVFSYLRSGIAVQQSTGLGSVLNTEAGGFVGFSYKNWEMPIYVFSPTGTNRNYVVGINWEWQHNTGSKNHGPVPSVKGRRKMAIE